MGIVVISFYRDESWVWEMELGSHASCLTGVRGHLEGRSAGRPIPHTRFVCFFFSLFLYWNILLFLMRIVRRSSHKHFFFLPVFQGQTFGKIVKLAEFLSPAFISTLIAILESIHPLRFAISRQLAVVYTCSQHSNTRNLPFVPPFGTNMSTSALAHYLY